MRKSRNFSFSVTDIDLWLYGRASAISREITIVDAKNKKTPQAIERIFWTMGLRSAVGATNAVVATTDKRVEVKAFGREHAVLVLDGHFIARLPKFDASLSNRLSEEDLMLAIGEHALAKLDGDWKGRVLGSKALLARGLSFNSCNAWLDHGRYFAEQVIVRSPHSLLARRLCYIVSSYIALAIDYLLRELSFLEETDRERSLSNGFRFGDRGSKGTKSIIDSSLALVAQFAENGSLVATTMRANLEAEFGALSTNVLSEYFAKGDVGKKLFSVSCELERMAMAKELSEHSSASVDAKSFMGCVLDFWGLDRRAFTVD